MPVAAISVNSYFFVESCETWRHSEVNHNWPIMTGDLIFCNNVWTCFPERHGKFGVDICFSFGDILGIRVTEGWWELENHYALALWFSNETNLNGLSRGVFSITDRRSGQVETLLNDSDKFAETFTEYTLDLGLSWSHRRLVRIRKSLCFSIVVF